jgi:succinate dehydrogenase / fumarate reductase, cytochrome b subunit
MAEAMELKRETTGESLIGSVMKFMGSAVGAKVVMALTGAGIWLFTVGHLAGNLLAFAGRNAFNTYAAGLADAPYIVWPTRIALLVGIPLHVFTAIRTVQMNRAARPEGYAYQEKTPARIAAKSMMITGAVILAFFLYHLAHFTFRVTGPQPTALLADGHHDAYSMLVMGFQQPLIALFYVVGQVLLAAHLSHGIYSMFQHLGLWGAKWTPFLKNAALVIGYGMCAAFASIPLAVLLGFIKP